jgi:uncharacterized DUF497 family protein
MVRSTPWRLVWREFRGVSFDPQKSDLILAERGFDLAHVARVFPGFVLERADTRLYVEPRFQVIGELLGELYFLVYTPRGRICRLITAWEADREHRVIWHEYR